MEAIIIIILSVSLPVLIYIYSVLDSDADIIIRNQQTLLENQITLEHDLEEMYQKIHDMDRKLDMLLAPIVMEEDK